MTIEGKKVLTTLWRYSPPDGRVLDIRIGPDINSARREDRISSGDVFQVSEEVLGPDGVLYLKLADNRGWVFDRKPGVGFMCIRQHPQAWKYTPSDGRMLDV